MYCGEVSVTISYVDEVGKKSGQIYKKDHFRKDL